jgi:predicted metalloprotease with PDZ domain
MRAAVLRVVSRAVEHRHPRRRRLPGRRRAADVGLAAALLASAASGALAQETGPVNEYRIAWPEPQTHLYDIELTFDAGGQDSADVNLPVWRPGRYVRQNYAANVQEVSAAEGDDALAIRKVGLSTWRVSAREPGGLGRVSVRYRYYANTMDAGASLLSAEEAYFNPVNLFMVPEGQIFRPVRLTVEAPKGWTAATALTPGRRANVFTAPDYHVLADAPTIVSPTLQSIQFTVDEVPYTIWFQGRFEPGAYRDRIAPDVERIVRVQTGIFGGAPFDEYFFLFHLLPYPFGHAVEHANSSSYAIQDTAFENDEGYRGFLGIIAHEFFHAWNVKRIRPAALWPYDYGREQFTTLHWFTEGVTSYFEALTMRWAGHAAPEEFLRDIGTNIDQLQRTPGRRVVPVSLASWDSWLSGYGQGNPNTTVNFYGKGLILGFLLDAEIRSRTDGEHSLTDVMRHLYETAYLQGRGVPEDGVQRAAEAVAGGSFAEFFDRYVHGTEELPYDRILEPFGLRVVQQTDESRPAASLKLRTRPDGEHASVVSIDPDSPALAAGIDVGDQIVAVAGRVAPASGWESLLAGIDPGERVPVTVRRRDRVLDVAVEAAGGGNVRWVLTRDDETTEREDRLFGQWMEGVPAAAPAD